MRAPAAPGSLAPDGDPARLELLDVLRGDSRLFLRYGVLSRERVSRETMPSSSLAS
jgi:hypothetical protein